jgi:peptidyl-dipeptidase Dcp
LTNPLITEFKTNFESTPFSKIKIADFIPAIKKTITVGLDEINSIINQKEDPSFKNTIEAIEKCGV